MAGGRRAKAENTGDIRLRTSETLDAVLRELSQMMQVELHIRTDHRLYLVCGMVMAGLGARDESGWKCPPLTLDELRRPEGPNKNDAAAFIDRIQAFLQHTGVQEQQVAMASGRMQTAFSAPVLSLVNDGETSLRRLYSAVLEKLLPVLKSGQCIDYAGQMFNALTDWIAVPDGAENDVVLTPQPTADLMAQLCQVGMNSCVWDLTAGTGVFLLSAMYRMKEDAQNLLGADEAEKKINQVHPEQLMGIEKLPEIYILAVLNMVLNGVGPACVRQGDSLQYDGAYLHGPKEGSPFPADVLLMNVPYSCPGNGLVFVSRALSMMKKGYAAILVQETAGAGQGGVYAREILRSSRLLASIRMPQLFIGKGVPVETAIFLFRTGTPHHVKDPVKFVDFTKDGYVRTSSRKRKKIRDDGTAQQRYAELIELVLHDSRDTVFLPDEAYVEDTISLEGDDWTFAQHSSVTDHIPARKEFMKTVNEHMLWLAGRALLGKESRCVLESSPAPVPALESQTWKVFGVDEVLQHVPLAKTKGRKSEASPVETPVCSVPAATSATCGHSLSCWVAADAPTAENVLSCTTNGEYAGTVFFQPYPFAVISDCMVLELCSPKHRTENIYLFVAAVLNALRSRFGYNKKAGKARLLSSEIILPAAGGADEPDYAFMDQYIAAAKAAAMRRISRCFLPEPDENPRASKQPETNEI